MIIRIIFDLSPLSSITVNRSFIICLKYGMQTSYLATFKGWYVFVPSVTIPYSCSEMRFLGKDFSTILSKVWGKAL